MDIIKCDITGCNNSDHDEICNKCNRTFSIHDQYFNNCLYCDDSYMCDECIEEHCIYIKYIEFCTVGPICYNKNCLLKAHEYVYNNYIEGLNYNDSISY